jgi:sialate O-acetylesterase
MSTRHCANRPVHTSPRFHRAATIIATAILCANLSSSAAVPNSFRLPTLVGDNMVLQRGIPVPVWGWAKPGTTVTVALLGKSDTATADKSGRWQAKVGPYDAGGPFDVTISWDDMTTTIREVLVGDVWLCSGQSNMGMPVQQVQNADYEITKANFPQIRLFTVPHHASRTLETDVSGKGWVPCTLQTVGSFSATGYFFGRELHKHLGVPIGLIDCSLGATPAEAWTSWQALKKLPDFRGRIEQLEKLPADVENVKDFHKRELADWLLMLESRDPGQPSKPGGWASPSFDDMSWKIIQAPGIWENAGVGMEHFDGTAWLRKQVMIPDSYVGRDLDLSLGRIDDEAVVFFNGVRVCQMTGDKFVEPGCRIPARLVKAGRNVVAVRVYDMVGGGGFVGKAEEMKLDTVSASAAGSSETGSADMSGEWRIRPAVDLKTLPLQPVDPLGASSPGALFNGMIAPLVPYGLKGVVWYQGESNATRATQYRSLFPALIRDWREQWNTRELPFVFVQLANYMPRRDQPDDDEWAELRDAQLSALGVPRTAMAVTVDIGDAADIHPKNKQEVGRRLALAARKVAYGETLVFSGPVYRRGSMRVEGSRARLKFEHEGSGLMAKGGAPLKGFAIAGKDRKFVWANARIEGNSVVVWSDNVPTPAAVRYAWAANPDATLCNKEGLPASPFRTDNWPGITR